jgi:hypothetical protein
MHPQAKHARFNLIVCSIAVLLTVAAYVLISLSAGPRQARGAFGFLGILGFLGLGRIYYRPKAAEGGIVLDERDTQIRDRSQHVAWRAVWLYWCLVCMGPWLWIAFRRGLSALEAPSIPGEWLPWTLWAALIVFQIVWSLSILAEYRGRGLPRDE